MALWAKVDVEMPTDGKLLGQPVVTRHLWTCLICLAKRQDEHGAIRGYDCALLAGCFNLPRKAVATALTYFQAARMVELEPADGTIRLLNFDRRQGPEDTTNERSRRYYGSHREEILDKKRSSRASPNGVPTVSSREVSSLEQNREEVEKKDQQQQLASLVPLEPAPLPTVFVGYVRSAFPTCVHPERLEARAKDAWPGVDLLTEAKKARAWEETNPTRVKRNKAAFLARWFNTAQERGSGRVNGTPALRGAVLSISEEARAEHDVPGRKRVGGS